MKKPDRYPEGHYTGLGVYPPPAVPHDGGGPGNRLLLAAAVLLLLALAAAGVALFGSGATRGAEVVPGTPSAEQRGLRGPADNERAYPAGTCLYETPGSQPGSVALRVTGCDTDDAVFVINHVVGAKQDCARHGDYPRYGLIQQDTSAGAVYCLSLVVPVDGCLRLAADVAPQRAACEAGTRRVAEIRPADDPGAACAGLAQADPWYHRDPRERRVSCLVPESG